MERLKKYWKPIIIAGILILLAGFFAYHYTGFKKTDDTAVLRAYLSDSINSSVNAEKVKEIESIQAQERVKTDRYKQNAGYWMKIAGNRAQVSKILKTKTDSLQKELEAKGDTTCSQFIEAHNIQVAAMQCQINALDSANQSLDSEAEGYSRQLYLSEQKNAIQAKEIQSKDTLINIQKSVIEQKNKDIAQLDRKNKNRTIMQKWMTGMGTAGGLVLGILLAK